MESNNDIDTIQVAKPRKAELETSTKAFLTVAQAYKIDSPAMYSAAADDLKKIKAKAKELEEQRKALTQPLDAVKSGIMDLFRGATEYLDQAERTLKGAMLTYSQEQERIAAEKQRQAEAEAQAERDRLAAESAQKAQEAAEAAAKGDMAAADAAQQEAAILQVQSVIAPAPVVSSGAQKLSGISMRDNWKAEVTDKLALVKYVLENPQYIDWLEVDMKPLNQMAKALKTNLSVPGVKAINDRTVSARAA